MDEELLDILKKIGIHAKILKALEAHKVHTIKALENLDWRLGFKLGDVGNVKAALAETNKDRRKKEIRRLVEAIKRKPGDATSEDKSSSKKPTKPKHHHIQVCQKAEKFAPQKLREI